ncbi:unnamed protein product, partial [Allacma fusca]
MGQKVVGPRQFRRIVNNAVEAEMFQIQQELLQEESVTKAHSVDSVTTEDSRNFSSHQIYSSSTSDISENEVDGTSDNMSDSEINFDSSISSSEDNFDRRVDNSPESFESQLKNWAVKESIKHQSLTQLLKILRPFHQDLPKCSKTLLSTP